MPLISIITVTYNAAAIVEDTMQSVLKQTFKDYEYLIIDGASKDRTLNIVGKYNDLNDAIQLVSEPDQGIYDAMNKGIARAKGSWIYFLNAGDLFYNDQVLEDFFANPIESSVQLIYGKVRTKNHPSGIDLTIGGPVTLQNFHYRVGLCHQAVFTHRSAFEDLGVYDTAYRVLADQEWFVRFFHTKARSVYIDKVVAWYEAVGQSSIMRTLNHKEHMMIVRQYFSTGINLTNKLRNPLVRLKIFLLKKVSHTFLYAWYRRIFFSN